MTIAIEQLYRLLNRFEQGPDGGAALSAYICPAGVWTIAYGCTKHPDGSSIKEGDTISPDQVYPYTEAAVERVISDIRATIKRPLNQYQEAAIASFVFNLGIGNLRKSTQLLPAIEAGRWEDAATALGEFVRAWGHFDGKWHRQALLGLRIRRYAEGLMLLGLDFDDACNADNIGMPKRREWQAEGVCPDGSKGRWYDVLLDGATEFNTIEELARTQPLPPLDLILTNKADPVAVQAAGKAGQPVSATQAQTPAVPAPPSKPAAPASPSVAAGPAPPPKPPQGSVVAPVPVPKPPALPTDVGSKPPVTIPPSVQVGTQSDMGPTTRTMWVSKRFWGGVLIIAGRLIIVADVGGHFSPAVKSFIGDGILMDWMTGVIVTMIGELVLDRGEKKATGPMDTPKRIALTTPAP